jgi:aminoglycoside 6'-N-acetyltransferase
MNDFRVIETLHLRLRRFRIEDAASFAAYRSDPEVARYQSWESPYAESRARRFINEMAAAEPGIPGEWFQVAVAQRATDELIGDLAFCVLVNDPRQAEIGFTIARAQQGQGYGTEAVIELSEYLFSQLGLHRIRANCDARNLASRNLLRKAGFRLEARLVEASWFKGEWATEEWYALLRREWVKGWTDRD